MDFGLVQGTKLVELFQHLIESRTIISLRVVESGFERLTCMTEVREDDKENQIVVDAPSGFYEEVEKIPAWTLQFNFNGPDKLEYIFTIAGGSIADRQLVLPFPKFVKRIQRRQNFRLPTPAGTKMSFQCKQLKGTLELINISLQGALGILRHKGMPLSKRPVLKVDQPVFKITIVFPTQHFEESGEVRVQKAEVVRIEQDKESYQHRYAFKFKHMDKEESRKLTAHIYRIQREYLQRR